MDARQVFNPSSWAGSERPSGQHGNFTSTLNVLIENPGQTGPSRLPFSSRETPVAISSDFRATNRVDDVAVDKQKHQFRNTLSPNLDLPTSNSITSKFYSSGKSDHRLFNPTQPHFYQPPMPIASRAEPSVPGSHHDLQYSRPTNNPSSNMANTPSSRPELPISTRFYSMDAEQSRSRKPPIAVDRNGIRSYSVKNQPQKTIAIPSLTSQMRSMTPKHIRDLDQETSQRSSQHLNPNRPSYNISEDVAPERTALPSKDGISGTGYSPGINAQYPNGGQASVSSHSNRHATQLLGRKEETPKPSTLEAMKAGLPFQVPSFENHWSQSPQVYVKRTIKSENPPEEQLPLKSIPPAFRVQTLSTSDSQVPHQITYARATSGDNISSLPAESNRTSMAGAGDDPLRHVFLDGSAPELPTSKTPQPREQQRPLVNQDSIEKHSGSTIKPVKESAKQLEPSNPTSTQAQSPYTASPDEIENQQDRDVAFSTQIAPSKSIVPPVATSLEAVNAILSNAFSQMYQENVAIAKNMLTRSRLLLSNSKAAARATMNDERSKFNTNPSFSKFIQKESPFSKLKSIQRIRDGETHNESQDTFVVESLGAKNRHSKLRIRVPVTKFGCAEINVPRYTQHVRLRDNFLGENSKELAIAPYQDEGTFRDDISQHYKVRTNDPTLTEWIEWHRDYVTDALTRLDLSWASILRYLVDSKVDVDDDNEDVRLANLKRQNMLKKTLEEESAEIADLKKQGILERLPRLDSRHASLAALLFDVFEDITDLSIFQMAKAYLPTLGDSDSSSADAVERPYRDLLCRICFVHDCQAHGVQCEYSDYDDGESDERDGRGTGDEDDVNVTEHNFDAALPTKTREKKMKPGTPGDSPDSGAAKPKNINHKIRIVTGKAKENDPADEHIKHHFHNYLTLRRHGKRHMVIPCDHPGTCDEAQCRCWRKNIHCDKNCGCAMTCKRRFPGCSTTCHKKRSTGGAKLSNSVCQTDKCLCKKHFRECDPDLCGKCGVDEVLDPANKYDTSVAQTHCTNCGITKGVPKKTYLFNSPLHGFGVTAGEVIKSDEFIMEYKGEVLSVPESHRREQTLYPKEYTYLYDADIDRVVDATLAGNKHRFVNHGNDRKKRNCYARLLICNGVVRIGLFAERRININDELLFDYAMPKEMLIVHGGQTTEALKSKQPGVNTARKQGDRNKSFMKGGKISRTGSRSTSSVPRSRSKGAATDFESDADDDDRPLARRTRVNAKSLQVGTSVVVGDENDFAPYLSRRTKIRSAKGASSIEVEVSTTVEKTKTVHDSSGSETPMLNRRRISRLRGGQRAQVSLSDTESNDAEEEEEEEEVELEEAEEVDSHLNGWRKHALRSRPQLRKQTLIRTRTRRASSRSAMRELETSPPASPVSSRRRRGSGNNARRVESTAEGRVRGYRGSLSTSQNQASKPPHIVKRSPSSKTASNTPQSRKRKRLADHQASSGSDYEPDSPVRPPTRRRRRSESYTIPDSEDEQRGRGRTTRQSASADKRQVKRLRSGAFTDVARSFP